MKPSMKGFPDGVEDPTDRVNILISGLLLIFILGMLLILGSGGCTKETKEVAVQPSSTGSSTPAVLALDAGYNAYVLPQGGYTSSGTPSGCCGAGLSLSVAQSGTDVDGNQQQQVTVGSTDVGQTADSDGDAGQGAGGTGAGKPRQGILAEQGTMPIEIITAKGEYFMGTADATGDPARIAIQAESASGSALVGTLSTFTIANYPLRLTYIHEDGLSEALPTFHMNISDAMLYGNSVNESFGTDWQQEAIAERLEAQNKERAN